MADSDTGAVRRGLLFHLAHFRVRPGGSPDSTRTKGAARILAASMAMLFSLNIGFTVYWVNTVVSHECVALNILTQHPVPKPANPGQNPSREENYRFYEGVLYWKNADGC